MGAIGKLRAKFDRIVRKEKGHNTVEYFVMNKAEYMELRQDIYKIEKAYQARTNYFKRRITKAINIIDTLVEKLSK